MSVKVWVGLVRIRSGWGVVLDRELHLGFFLARGQDGRRRRRRMLMILWRSISI